MSYACSQEQREYGTSTSTSMECVTGTNPAIVPISASLMLTLSRQTLSTEKTCSTLSKETWRKHRIKRRKWKRLRDTTRESVLKRWKLCPRVDRSIYRLKQDKLKCLLCLVSLIFILESNKSNIIVPHLFHGVIGESGFGWVVGGRWWEIYGQMTKKTGRQIRLGSIGLI